MTHPRNPKVQILAIQQNRLLWDMLTRKNTGRNINIFPVNVNGKDEARVRL